MVHLGWRQKSVIFIAFLLMLTLLPSMAAGAAPMPTGTAAGGCTTVTCSNAASTPAANGTVTNASCAQNGQAYLFSSNNCDANNATVNDALQRTSAWTSSSGLEILLIEFNTVIEDAAAGIADWILRTELGGKTAYNSPTITCQLGASGCADGNSWFIGQLAIVRNIGMYFIIPMLMLVVIQSVVRGSLYFLLRAVLIMLPVAVLGGIFFVEMAQLFSNISDDMANAIADYTASVTDYGTGLKNTMLSMSPAGFGLFTYLCFFFFILAAVAIFIELILREIGIYLAILFLPLAFAAMVWPPAVKYCRRLVELVLGLIFSKVFIIGALSLGIAAFGHTNTTGGQTNNGNQSQTSAVVSAIFSGSVMMVMSAFAGGRVLAFTPAAVGAAEGYVMRRSQITGRGSQLSYRLGNRVGRLHRRAANLTPSGNFQNPPPMSEESQALRRRRPYRLPLRPPPPPPTGRRP